MWASLFIWIINVVTGVVISWAYGRWAAVKKGLPAVVIISLIQGGGQAILSQISPALAAFIPSCLSLIAIFFIGKTQNLQGIHGVFKSSQVMLRQAESKEAEKIDDKSLTMNQAFFPFYVLTAITLLVLLISPLKTILEQWKVGFSFPETMTAYGVANHAYDLYSPVMPLT